MHNAFNLSKQYFCLLLFVGRVDLIIFDYQFVLCSVKKFKITFNAETAPNINDN